MAPTAKTERASLSEISAAEIKYADHVNVKNINPSGTKNALKNAAKSPFKTKTICTFFIFLAIIIVKSEAKSVAAVPKSASSGVENNIFDKKHPTVSPNIASGKKIGRMHKHSAKRSCKNPNEIGASAAVSEK